MLINHGQSSTAFVCFLSEENDLAFGVHGPMLPSSIKIVRKLVELTEQYLLIFLCGYCQHSGKCHKKSEAIAQTFVFYTIRVKNKKNKNKTRAGGTRDYAAPGTLHPVLLRILRIYAQRVKGVKCGRTTPNLS